MTLLLVLLVAGQASVGVQQSGTRQARAHTLNCGTNMTCSVAGGVVTLDSAGGGGGGGAPTNATYITQTANATLTNEQALSSLSTGVVKVTTGTGALSTAVSGTDYAPPTSGTALQAGNGSGGFSAYAGTSCTNQFPRSLSAAGAATCASVALGTDVSGTLAAGNGGLGATQPTCGAGQFLTCNGTSCSCSTPASGGSPLVLAFGAF